MIRSKLIKALLINVFIMPIGFAFQTAVKSTAEMDAGNPPTGMSLPTAKEKQFFKEKGYYYTQNQKTAQLLASPDKRPYNANLKSVKLNFEFPELKSIKKDDIVKYQNCEPGALNCLMVYFNTNDLGRCWLALDYVKDTPGTLTYTAESVEYEVNNKPGNMFAEGSEQTGVSYSIEWTDSRFQYQIHCDTVNFDKNQITEEVQLARKIDSELSIVK